VSPAGTGDDLVIHIDGASRGNPGEAAFGIQVKDGEQVTDLYGYLGSTTNNVAEYQALLHALKHALGRGARRVEIRSDSELVVRQVSGRYQVKHPGLKPLHREAMELLQRFERARVCHVPREQNRDADRLANLALDQRASRLDG
jgi:ribonuclease HI